MRREELYLVDIIEAADAINRFIGDRDFEAFADDDLLQSAVLQKLTIIGEAAARLPVEFRAHHTGVDWADIAGFRNIAVHAYFAAQWSIVWVAATQDALELRQQVVEILAREYPDVEISEPPEE